MNRYINVLLVLVAVFFSLQASNVIAQSKKRSITSVCKTTTTLPNGGYIYKNSAPLRSGGVGTPLVGYRKEPTLIGNVSMSRFRTNIYASNGVKIGSCPWASAHGHRGGRYRCTMQTSALRKTAVSKAKSAAVYFQTASNKCVKIPDAGRCYGSVKGLCRQLIK